MWVGDIAPSLLPAFTGALAHTEDRAEGRKHAEVPGRCGEEEWVAQHCSVWAAHLSEQPGFSADGEAALKGQCGATLPQRNSLLNAAKGEALAIQEETISLGSHG